MALQCVGVNECYDVIKMADTKPKLLELLRYTSQIRSSWEKFGTFLDISHDDLEAINRDKHDCEAKMTAVCNKWLQVNPQGTWQDITMALEKMGRNDILEKINKSKLVMESKPKKTCIDFQLASMNESTDADNKIFDAKQIKTPLVLLYGKYIDVLSTLQAGLTRRLDSNQIDIQHFSSFLSNFFQVQCAIGNLETENDPIDAVFHPIKDNLNCFDTLLLNNINQIYLGNAYEKKIVAYEDDLQKFEKDNSILDLERTVEKWHKQNVSGVVVVIKLGEFWNDKSIGNLNHLVRKLFGHNAALLKLVRIHHSLLTIVYKTPTWLVLSLIINAAHVNKEVAYAQIHSVQVGRILLRFQQKGSPFERLLMIPKPQEIQFLFDIGANINTEIRDALPMHTAMVFNSPHALRKLLSLSRKQMASIDHMSGFIIDGAHIPGYRHCIFLLLQYGIDPNSQNHLGETSLLLASWRGDEKLVSLLLRWKADPNISSKDCVTPLYAASQDGYVACVKLLLKHNANPNIQDTMAGWGKSPLYMACQEGYYECAELLLKANADPNVQKTNGATPLFIASHAGNNKIIKLLLRFNADPNISTYDGISPAQIARHSGHTECLESLLYSE